MAAQPPPSSSSATRRSRTGDRVVGSFLIEDEIGKGSFATVFRGQHKVRWNEACMQSLLFPFDSISIASMILAESLVSAVLIATFAGYRSSRSNQVRQSLEAEQEIEGEPLLRNRDSKRPPSSTHRCPHRLSRISDSHTFGNGILRTRGLVIFHQEAGQATG